MKHTKSIFVKSLTLALGLTLASPSLLVQADEGARQPSKMMQMMSNKLSLSEQQKQDMKAIMTEAKLNQSTARTELKSYREQMKQLVNSDEFDELKFTQLQQQSSPLKLAMELQRAKTRQAIYALLTDEQKDKLTQLEEQRSQKKQRRMQKRKSRLAY